MECPHLNDDVKVDRSFVRRTIKGAVKCLECPVSSSSSNGGSPPENWMCLNCGQILCGRYVNRHAMEHSTSNPGHSLCMNTLNQSVFCYLCDDFVINETVQLEEVRAELQSTNTQPLDCDPETASSSSSLSSQSAATTGTGAEEAKSSSSSGSGSKISTGRQSSTDSGWADEVMPQSLARRLRPRKRTISSDSNQDGASAASKEVSSSTNSITSAASSSSSNSSSSATPSAAKRTKSAATKKVVGLRNLGNTCFMNSVLQSLSNIQEFSSYFYTLPSMDQIKAQRKKTSSGGYVSSSSSLGGSGLNGCSSSLIGGLSARELEEANVVEELRKVLLNLGQGGDGSKAISPECLFLVIWKVVPQFRGHRQHDAHEFLRYMLDRLHTELQQNAFPSVGGGTGKVAAISGPAVNGSSAAVGAISSSGSGGTSNGDSNSLGGYGGSKRNSIVTNVFGGVLQSEVRCLICGMDSKKHDPFLDLSLDIPEKFYSKEATAANGEEEKPACHIWDCLSSFTEVEELAETELYYCNSCKCKQKSTKRFWIRRLPNVLCLHIKRFRWSNFFRTKIDLRISFPIKALDMSQFVLNSGPETRRSNSSNSVYDLAAVIVHHGNGSSCGHYTSYAYSSGAWLHFNDHTVKEVPYSTVADCKPYILFYSRRDMSSSSSSNNNKSTSPTSTS